MPIVLGLDPGSHRLGYGLLEVRAGRLSHVAHGTFKARPKEPLHLRLAELYTGLCEVLDSYRPQSVAIEKVFTARNVASALTLGQSRGMILLAVGERRLDLSEYAAAEVKKAVTGHGGASKDQVASMVARILAIETKLDDRDSSDALAVALCHATALDLKGRLARGRPRWTQLSNSER